MSVLEKELPKMSLENKVSSEKDKKVIEKAVSTTIVLAFILMIFNLVNNKQVFGFATVYWTYVASENTFRFIEKKEKKYLYIAIVLTLFALISLYNYIRYILK